MYSNYGVDSKNSSIEYKTRYHSAKNQKYQFYTTLLNDPEIVKDLFIEIRHLYKPHEARNKEFVSSIAFETYNLEKNLNIEVKSVVLMHKNINGDTIEARNIINELPKGFIKSDGRSVYYYKKIYSKKLPETIIEYVAFEIIVNGKTYKFEYEYPLEYKLEYTFWDVMSSV